MNKRKKIVIISSIISFVALFLVIFLRNTFSASNRFVKYSKYETFITIATVKGNLSKSSNLNMMNDGTNTKISTSNFDPTIYIVENDIQYVENNKIYRYEMGKTYKDINVVLSSITSYDILDEKAGIMRCSAVINPEKIDEILEALFIKDTAKKNSVVEFSIRDKHINSFKMTIEDLSNFDKVSILINFDNLDDNYNVDVSSLSGLRGGILTTYDREDLKENILEIK